MREFGQIWALGDWGGCGSSDTRTVARRVVSKFGHQCGGVQRVEQCEQSTSIPVYILEQGRARESWGHRGHRRSIDMPQYVAIELKKWIHNLPDLP